MIINAVYTYIILGSKWEWAAEITKKMITLFVKYYKMINYDTIVEQQQ